MPEQSPPHVSHPDQEYQAACERAVVFDLSSHGKVELSGPDAVSFLHNLCTNDIVNLPPGAGCEAFLTTHKARIVGHIFASRLRRDGGDVLLLDTVPGSAEKLLQHFNHYLISEQVELTDRTKETALVHLCGPQSQTILEAVLASPLPDLPELHHAELSLKPSLACRVRRHALLNLPGYDLFFPADNTGPVLDALYQAGAVPAGSQTFEVLRVEAGFPLLGKDMDENRLVMEVGRTSQAISYTKGCYLGQEPIVMARDRGHVNRTLMGLRIVEGGPVPPGANVFHEGKEAGGVTSSVASPRARQAVALAYLQRGSQTPETAVEIEAPEGRRPALIASLPLVGPVA